VRLAGDGFAAATVAGEVFAGHNGTGEIGVRCVNSGVDDRDRDAFAARNIPRFGDAVAGEPVLAVANRVGGRRSTRRQHEGSEGEDACRGR